MNNINNSTVSNDSICYHKLLIDQKNPTADTDEQFIQNIFKQLNGEQLPAAF
jgi:hypothetical protein